MIEHWHQRAISGLKIMYSDEHEVWDGVPWDGKAASLFAQRDP